MQVSDKKGMSTVYAVLAIFIAGFLAFTFFSWRVGFHPTTWRQSGAEASLYRVIASCYTGDDSARTQFMLCAEKKIRASVKVWGVRALMEALQKKQTLDTDRAYITQCHDLSHAIGAAGVFVNKNVKAALPQCLDTCVYGCQHGAVSAWYAMGNDIRNTIADLCVKDVDWTASPQGQGACFHEVGHAVASLAGNDVIQALHLCDTLVAIGRIDCGYGVFMELFEPATFTDTPQPLPANHPVWCETLWPPYKEYCYHQAGVNDYGRHTDDARAYEVCLRVPSQYQDGCFHNLGTNIFYSYQYKHDQAGAIKDFCIAAGLRWYMPCVFGAVESSVLSQKTAKGAIDLCQLLDNEEKIACFQWLGATLQQRRTQNEKESICQSIEGNGSVDCITAVSR